MKTDKLKKSLKKAKQEAKETEKVLSETQEEVVDAAEESKGEVKENLTRAARDLEKATISSGDALEATEEADLEVKEIK